MHSQSPPCTVFLHTHVTILQDYFDQQQWGWALSNNFASNGFKTFIIQNLIMQYAMEE